MGNSSPRFYSAKAYNEELSLLKCFLLCLLALCYKLNNDGVSSKAGAFILILQGTQITLSNWCAMTTAAVFLIYMCQGF